MHNLFKKDRVTTNMSIARFQKWSHVTYSIEANQKHVF
jgi:hypothetical protein